MSKAGLPIIFEDSQLIVLDKPSGLLTIPDRFDPEKPNLSSMLKSLYEELYIVHRIDKETSGLVLFAKNADTHKEISQLFESHLIRKKYQCFTEGRPSENAGRIDLPIAHSEHETGKMMVHRKGKPSVTNFLLLEPFQHFAFLEVSTETGRTHQIRVHMAAIGCPLVCDSLYGKRASISIIDIKPRAKMTDYEGERPLLSRTALHASNLEFTLSGQNYQLESSLPKDLKALQNQLRKWQSI